MKWLKKLLIASGTIGLFASCELVQPEGVRVKAEADGIISQGEEGRIMEAIHSKKDIRNLTPEAQGLINDANIFFKNEFERQGLEYAAMGDDLHLYITKDVEELSQEYKEHNLSDAPIALAGFFSGANSTIYIMPKGIIGFYRTFQHELGHYMRYGCREFSSMANASYSVLKLIALNKAVGKESELLSMCLLSELGWEDRYDGIEPYYALGCVAFVSEANRHDGNLEKALDHIMNAPEQHIERNAIEFASGYDSLRHAYAESLASMARLKGFRESFVMLNDEDFEMYKNEILRIADILGR